MGVLVKSGEYALAKLVNQYKIKANRLIEISDEEARLLELTEYHGEPEIEPTGEPEPEVQYDYSKDYLTFEAIDDCKFSINNTFYYSIDNGNTWNVLQENEETPLIAAGNKILWKCQNPAFIQYGNGYGTSDRGIGTYVSSGKFNISGNIMSLINSDNFIDTYSISNTQFYSLFKSTDVVNAKNLIIPKGCMALSAFENMFRDCSSLIIAPTLNEKTLLIGCYRRMFYNCTLLNYIKCLAINLKNGDIIDNNLYHGVENWLNSVYKSGTFIKHKDANWEISTSGIPNNWLIEEVEE